MKSSYIIITGPPASGKSTLARQLGQQYDLPLVQFDTVQESLFDIMETADSEVIATASYNTIFNQVEEFVKQSQPFIVESNFNPRIHTALFKRIEQNYGVTAIQIVCKAARSVLVNRFEARWRAGARHPKHHDDKHFEELRTAKLVELQPMDLQGPILRFNTSKIGLIEYHKLTSSIDLYLIRGEQDSNFT